MSVLSRPKLVLVLCSLLLLPLSAMSQSGSLVHHVSGQQPVQGPSREMAADRPADASSSAPHVAAIPSSATSPWQLQASIPGAIIHDLSFPTPTVGFAAAELGQVWKTTDGGATWTEIVNVGFPYYWYGVQALNTNDVVISGFNDTTGSGMIRWSHDGGVNWSADIVMSSSDWALRNRFVDPSHGLVSDITGPTVHYTTDGGATAADWTQTTPTGASGWFSNEISLLPDLQANASGINYCSSTDGGAQWTCRASIDSVFDGETFFINDNVGWVASGEISPNVEGWVHRTTDGGQTWSGRVLDSPWPIREIFFLSPTMGWAAGGNIFTNVGGIYFSTDGGQTWTLDVDTGNEMDACDSKPVGDAYQVWCAGYLSAGGVIYTVQGASTPALNPPPQTYTSSQSVTLTTSTPGATLYYTTDGSTPTTSSTQYTGPIAVSSTVTLQAIAAASGLAPSLVASGIYTIQLPAAAPGFLPAPQTFTAAVSVTLSDSTSNASIYYTTDGTKPSTSSTLYTGPIVIPSTLDLQAIAVAPNFSPSLIASGIYTITPQLQLSGGSSSIIVTAGSSATVQLSIGASANASTITFACSGLPAGAQCSFSPNSVSAPANVALTISTSSSSAAANRRTFSRTISPWGPLGLLAGLLLLPAGAFRIRRRGHRLFAGLLLMLGLVGCGSNSTPPPPVQNTPVQATVTVTASAAGATAASIQIQLTINH